MDKEKETVHETKYINKELPTIFFQNDVRKDINDISSTVITVSDNTSEKALDTFKRVRDLVK
jgi:hypothetical protein